MARHYVALASVGIAIAGLVGTFAYLDRPYKAHLPEHPRPEVKKPNPIVAERKKLDDLSFGHPAEAEKGYRSFIAVHETSPDTHVQEQVGLARYRIGYIQARRKDFASARQTFLETSAKYKGAGMMIGDFGGVKDGAEYQAAVCLVGEGKKAEARQAFLDFMRKEPTSPLATAAYRRLVRLNNGISIPDDEKLLQHDLNIQQADKRMAVALCGPKVLERMLPILGKPKVGYEELAKICGTTEKGTTLQQLHDALRHYGLASYGAMVNRTDFATLPTPAVMEKDDHFILVLSIHPEYMEIFDPMEADVPSKDVALPAPDDPDFQAVVLTLAPPSMDTTNAEIDAARPAPRAGKYPDKPKTPAWILKRQAEAAKAQAARDAAAELQSQKSSGRPDGKQSGAASRSQSSALASPTLILSPGGKTISPSPLSLPSKGSQNE